ncbi:5'-nucleotidase C-terminal domain-containing protein [Geomicrobium sediminis]|uniref:2',3'-cyclic-nucleotide 2'-phosphodiesterase (5'-nucleotidase family) n=1 Tax=Geomicrobium sediminis TaxID=1347788 RepID=A0ABS2PDK7_9BACL|nr:5'-nucleotidase C-terminal domain-containing protein [Geomicrobium sediminis]MBM7633357.1 2',3'-cyclic-nucleotide 2'-phosphodiesterase (5'-nucleotidase family) [Geomicrobium sediminis]
MKKFWLAALLTVPMLSIPQLVEGSEVKRGDFLKKMMDEMDIEVEHYDTSTLAFEDVSEEYAPYVTAAVELGITTGRTDTRFGTEDPVTRAHASLFMTRAMNLEADDLSTLLQFEDVSETSFASEALATVAQYGIMTGYTNGYMRPNQNIAPHQVDAILERQDNYFTKRSIVHTNDMHGRVMQNDDEGVMGLAKVHTIYDLIKQQSEDVLLVDGGDTFHGTNHVHYTEGQAMVELMNHIGFDAMVAGNHEFNYGYNRLLELSDSADFPILASNVIVDETGEPLVERYSIAELADKKIGFVGITTEDTPIRTHPSNVEGLTFYNDVEIAKREVKAMEDKVDHVVLLTHSGHSVDQMLAEEIDGVDLIIGGHSHTAIERPYYHDQTFIAQAHEHTKAVGVVNLYYYEDELASMNGQLIRDTNDRFEPHPETEELVQQYVTEVDEALSEVIGSVDTRLEGDREVVRREESNLGNLITDAMRQRTDADVAIMNGGGIRDSIEAGDVTIHDVMNAFPFINLVEAQEMTGDIIVEALEQSLSVYPESNGGFLHVSGMEVQYDPEAAPYERVTSVEINGEPLDTAKTYLVGTNDFLAAGGDGYSMFEEQEIVLSTGELLSEILIEYIRSGEEIPDVEGRIAQQ